jgi:hypothetical protein
MNASAARYLDRVEQYKSAEAASHPGFVRRSRQCERRSGPFEPHTDVGCIADELVAGVKRTS